MGKMKELAIDIMENRMSGRSINEQVEDLLNAGFGPSDIASVLGIKESEVDAVITDIAEEYDRFEEYQDSMDGDTESALASAGFGMDESYNMDSDYY